VGKKDLLPSKNIDLLIILTSISTVIGKPKPAKITHNNEKRTKLYQYF